MMPIKSLTCLICMLMGSYITYAQQTVERKSKLTPQVSEVYNVLENKLTVMHGMYAAYFKKQLVAAGKYDNGKKIGTWSFFDPQGKLLQRYNYDQPKLVYEAPEDSTATIVYRVDKTLNDTDRITKPIRIGGRYYGYLRYTNLVKLPEDLSRLDNQTSAVTMELLVSPGGRLAEYKLRIQSVYFPDVVLNLNIDLLSEEEKVFVPATYNYNPVSCQIIVKCQFSGSDTISL
jgi:hypothetical protein